MSELNKKSMTHTRTRWCLDSKFNSLSLNPLEIFITSLNVTFFNNFHRHIFCHPNGTGKGELCLKYFESIKFNKYIF